MKGKCKEARLAVERHRKRRLVVIDSDSDEDVVPPQVKNHKGNSDISGKCYSALNCLGEPGFWTHYLIVANLFGKWTLSVSTFVCTLWGLKFINAPPGRSGISEECTAFITRVEE